MIGARLLMGVGALAALSVAFAAVHHAGVLSGKAKVTPDRDRWRETARSYLRAANAWEASFRKAEGLRVEEGKQARRSADQATRACDARVATARRSAVAIQSIVTKEVQYDASRCPVRAVVGADELRNAVGLPAAARR